MWRQGCPKSPGLHCSFAELWVVPHEKRRNDGSEPVPEWPSLTFDHKPISGFDLGVLGPIYSPAAADTSSGE